MRADIYPRYLPAPEYPRRASEEYEAGADGLCWSDTCCRVPRKSEWSAIRRLGHSEALEQLAQEAAGMTLDPSHTPATNG